MKKTWIKQDSEEDWKAQEVFNVKQEVPKETHQKQP